MRVVEIEVNGLFDRFDHALRFPDDQRVSIMIAPNGFGKTMILRMINTLFNQPIRALIRMPFREFVVRLDDESTVSARRTHRQDESDDESGRFDLELIFRSSEGEEQSFRPGPQISEKEMGFPLGVIEEIIPQLDQVGRALWRDRRTGVTLELDEVIERYGDELPIDLRPTSKTPGWLQTLRGAIPVRFIDTERLTHPLTGRSRLAPPHRRMPQKAERTVRRYSAELGKLVQQTLSEYGALSQSLDRTFPARLVEEPAKSDFTMEALRNELAEVEAKRQKLVEAGLLAQDEDAFGAPVPDIDKVDESRRGVLAVYARDAQRKLGVFDEVLAKVEALKRIANDRFLHKEISIGSGGIQVIASDGRPLDLEMLSSGEQHELVLLYDFLFRVSRDSFILVDEPELSLHVAWQERFLSDITEMAELSDFRVLLATHSPQIIGDHYELAIELKGPA